MILFRERCHSRESGNPIFITPPSPSYLKRGTGGGVTINIITYVIIVLALFVSPTFAVAAVTSYKDGDIIKADTTWKGRVEVDGVVFVPEGVTLTISPGTTVSFRKSDKAYKETGETADAASEVLIPGSGIRVEGKIVAEGAKDRVIAFTSAEKTPRPGDWGCIFLDHSLGSVFKYCRFEYSAYTIHAHFSRFTVARSVLTNNEDGSRIGVSRASFDHCDIIGNSGKGLNFRQCKNTVSWCNITGNHEGVFLNEKDSGCVIEYNNIYNNKGMDLRLGEFHKDDVSLKNNWWGTANAREIREHVYDKKDDPAVGQATIEPAARRVAGAGVKGPEIDVLWKFKTGGYVDCSPLVSDGAVYFGSWDKNFYAVKAATGELIWKFAAGDCVDSSPDIASDRLIFGSWNRNIYCLNARTGKLAWKYQMTPSNFDDHRQSSPAVWSKNLVVMGGFNGKIIALSIRDGMLWWTFDTGGPIRSRPSVWDRSEPGGRGRSIEITRTYVGSGDGVVYAFDLPSGIPLWRFKAGGPVNSSPLVAGGRVYFGCRDGSLYCISEPRGLKLWSYPTGGRIEYSSPLLAGPLIVIGDCDGRLYAVDSITGKLVWSFTGGGGIYSSPRLSGDKVVYGDNSGDIYCLDPKTGGLLGIFKANDAVQGLSTGPDGVIYAGSRDGFLYALRVSE